MITGTEMVVANPDRPAILTIDNCKIYIAVHDEHHRRIRAEYKNKLKLAHPDMQGHVTKEMVITIPEKPDEGIHDVSRYRRGCRCDTCRQAAREYKIAFKAGARRTGPRTHHSHGSQARTFVRVFKLKAKSEDFRRIKKAYDKWQGEEVKWYAQYGLTPPQWGG